MLQPQYPRLSADPTSFQDAGRGCMVLIAELGEVREALKRPDHDARVAALRNAEHLVGAALMVLNTLDIGSRSDEAGCRALFGIETGPVQTAADDLDKFARIGMLTMVQFQMENMLSNVIMALGGSPGRGWQAVCQEVARLTDLSDRSQRVLRVPAAMRNTLHNNGIHRGASFETTIGYHRYRFRKDGRFSQAGWHHIVHVLRSELRVIQRIFRMPNVNAVLIVEDQFVEIVR